MIAVVFVRGRNWDARRKFVEQDGLEGHVDFIHRNRDEGLVIQGGPLHELDSYVTDDLVGLALWDTDCLDEAQNLIETDPVVEAGVFAYRLYLWGGPSLRRP